MYHHSTAKVTKSNQAHRSKKLVASVGKQSAVKKMASRPTGSTRAASRVTTAKKSLSKKTTSGRRQTSTKKSPSKKKKRSLLASWLAFFGGVVQSIIAFILVLALVVFVVVSAINFFAPRLFTLEGAKKLLFMTNETAVVPKAFFVYLDADNRIVSATNISSELPVKVLGGYGQYPLRSLAALLKLEQKDQQSILAAYNFALGEVIDEVYFLENIPDTTEKNGLSKMLRQLMMNHWRKYHQVPEMLLETYFFVQSDPTFNLNQEIAATDDLSKLRDQAYTTISGGAACPVVVVNATQQGGLAGQVSRVLEKDGFWVARVTSGETTTEQTTLYYDENDSQCQEVRQKLERVFPQAPVSVSDLTKLQHYRAALVIVLSADMED